MAGKAGPAGPDLDREMAMARFALIAPAVQGTFDQATKAEYYRSVSAKLVRMPDGVSVNAFLANSTNEPAPIAPSKRRRFRQRKPAASG